MITADGVSGEYLIFYLFSFLTYGIVLPILIAIKNSIRIERRASRNNANMKQFSLIFICFVRILFWIEFYRIWIRHIWAFNTRSTKRTIKQHLMVGGWRLCHAGFAILFYRSFFLSLDILLFILQITHPYMSEFAYFAYSKRQKYSLFFFCLNIKSLKIFGNEWHGGAAIREKDK